MKYVAPSANRTAFSCPHCGVLTTQYWFSVFADQLKKDQKPFLVPPTDTQDWSFREVEDESRRNKFVKLVERMRKQEPFLWKGDSNFYDATHLYNVHVSRCYDCSKLALWLNDQVLYPTSGEAPAPNPDLPDDIKRDYAEASSILNLSPRGSAALIRLAIQKLCKHLGQSGENINLDIKALVAAGLDTRVQRALDAVRVIGNNAVHPGSIDLRDDKATAETLFGLLNLIAEKTISEPKHVDEVYGMLPESARKAIEARDKEVPKTE